MADEQKKSEVAKPQAKGQSEAARQALSAKDAKLLGLDPAVYGG